MIITLTNSTSMAVYDDNKYDEFEAESYNQYEIEIVTTSINAKSKALYPEVAELQIADDVKLKCHELIPLYQRNEKTRKRKMLIFYCVHLAYILLGGILPPPEKIAKIVGLGIKDINAAFNTVGRRHKMNFELPTAVDYVEYYWDLVRFESESLDDARDTLLKILEVADDKLDYPPHNLAAAFTCHYAEIHGYSPIALNVLKEETSSIASMDKMKNIIMSIHNMV